MINLLVHTCDKDINPVVICVLMLAMIYALASGRDL